MKLFTQPKLCKSKTGWYVWYRYYDEANQKWHMFKHREGMNYETNLKKREKKAREIIKNAIEFLNKDKINPLEGIDTPENNSLKNKSLKILLDEMLAIKKSLRPRSYQTYKYANDVLNYFLKDTNQESIKASGFNHTTALKFADWMSRERKYTGRSFNNIIMLNRIIFNMLVEREVIEKNPFSKVKKQPEETGKHIAFDASQKAQLKEYLSKHDKRLWLFVKFIYHLWIRPYELLQIKVKDVMIDRRVVMVYAGTGKNRRQLPADIPDSFISEVKSMRLDKFKGDDYLFGFDLQTCSNNYHRNTVSKRHSKILEAFNYSKEHTCYSWKHTGMCDAHDNGVSIYDIMRQARHHSLDQTLNYFKSMGRLPNTGFKEKAPSL